MHPNQARFVTLCQQLLVLAAVLAVLTPAASVVTLDIVGSSPVERPHGTLHRVASDVRPAVLPTAPVEATDVRYPLTAPAGVRARGLHLQAGVRKVAAGTELVSSPVPVTGYGAVGLTWDRGVDPAEEQLSVEVRTRTGDAWSQWTEVPYDPEHAPDPDSAEGRHAVPGTDVVMVGEVDEAQVRAVAADGTAMPSGMGLTVIDPGEAGHTARQAPEIETGPAGVLDSTDEVPADDLADGEEGLALRASVYTPRPRIFSRAQWGADEKMRTKSSLRYFEVHAGFVHHTVNANDYARADVPAILRSIYRYHTRTRGWSDIGYNFLVDRFGRIWEGRWGGVDRPVVGAHTLNHNEYSFAMSAIGNYETAKPSDRMINAYGRLFAWKLSLHGVDADSAKQQVGSKAFPAVNGHRDAASTACPGRYLYAELDRIRGLATSAQVDWAGRDIHGDLASTPHPDLVVRRASDKRVLVVPTGGLLNFKKPIRVRASSPAGTDVVPTPDVTGDGYGDLVVREPGKAIEILPGDGSGRFGAPVRRIEKWYKFQHLTAVGDVTGDGLNDLVGRNAKGRLRILAGKGQGAFAVRKVAGDWRGFQVIRGVGDLTGDRRPDLLVQDAAGVVQVAPGTANGGFGALRAVAGDFAGLEILGGLGDITGDGRPDLLVRSSAGTSIMPGRATLAFGALLGPFKRLGGGLVGSAGPVVGSDAVDVVGRRTNGRIVVFPNRGTFNLGAPIDTGVTLPDANRLLNVGDWDRDGYGDVVARAASTGQLTLYRGDGTGRLTAAGTLGSLPRHKLLSAAGDVTGDGYPDLMGQPKDGVMRIYPGNGLAGLAPSYPAYGSIAGQSQIGAGLWTTDGAPDSLVRRKGTLVLYRGNGPGGLTGAPQELSGSVAGHNWVVGISDARLKGRPDLITREKRTGRLWLWNGTPTGLGAKTFLGDGMEVYDLVG